MKIQCEKFFIVMSLVLAVAIQAHAQTGSSAKNIYERTLATYAALKTYSDTGTVATEYRDAGEAIKEQHTFKTFYRAPREFFFEFKEDQTAGGEQFVIWCNGGDFQTWWSETRVHEKYEKGRGSTAFALAALPTKESALQIAPLIFSQSELHGAISNLKEPRLAGTENINGRNCYKLVAETRETGLGEDARKTTVWIDAENYLVRKVFEDTPQGTGAGIISRVTTTFEPKANPTIEASRFAFSPPKEK